MTLAAVRNQYTEFPYPVREPEGERERLLERLLGQVALIDQLFWAGRRPIDSGFCVLDAGCGTGDTTIFLAEQLRDSGARVVALDFSHASLAVARRRAEVRGLTNIEFVEASMLDLPALGLGRFDYIVSAGVLHHLASPEDGLATLARALKPDGGIGLMVYGAYGRAEIYLLQELFRRIAPPEMEAEQRLRIVKRTLTRLRPEHPAAIYGDSWQAESGEHGDVGLYDLFLHSQDRAYTVPQIYDWLEHAGLELLSFGFPVAYDPKTWAPAVEVTARSSRERHAVAELLHGRMGNHTFFAARAGHAPPASPASEDRAAAPAWTYWDGRGQREELLRGEDGLAISLGAVTVEIKLTAITRALLRRVDGVNSVGEIIDATTSEFSVATPKQVRESWKRVADELRSMNYLALSPAA